MESTIFNLFRVYQVDPIFPLEVIERRHDGLSRINWSPLDEFPSGVFLYHLLDVQPDSKFRKFPVGVWIFCDEISNVPALLRQSLIYSRVAIGIAGCAITSIFHEGIY